MNPQGLTDVSNEVTAGVTQDDRGRRWPRGFWWILAIAAAVRIILIVASQLVDHSPLKHPAEESDMGSYMQYGEIIANGMEPREAIPHHRDRLLPVLLGGLFYFTGRSIVAAQILNASLALCGMFAMVPLARRILSERGALVASGLWVFDPQFVGQSCLPLTENVATPLIVLALLLFAGMGGRGEARRAVWGSIALMFAFFARTNSILIGCALVLWIVVCRSGCARRIQSAAIVCGVLLLGWLVSSALTYRMAGVFAPNTHVYLLWGHEAAKIMVLTGEAPTREEAKEQRKAMAREHIGPDAGLRKYWETKEAMDREYVRGHRDLQLWCHLQALVAITIMPDRWSIPSLLGIHREGGLWHSNRGFLEKAWAAIERWGPVVGGYAALHAVFTSALWVGVCLAVVGMRGDPQNAISLLLILTLLGVIATALVNVEAIPRYRLPGMPMMAILAVYGYLRFIAFMRARRAALG